MPDSVEVDEIQPLVVKDKGTRANTHNTGTGILSTLTFSWITPLLALGHLRSIKLDDIPHVSPIDSVYRALPILYDKLGLRLRNNNNNRFISDFVLAKALFLSAWKEIIWTGFAAAVYAISGFVCPFLIDTFIQCLKRGAKKEGCILALVFCVASVVQIFVRRHFIFKLEQVGMRLRAGISAMIYNKGLALSSLSTSGGDIVNLVAVDVDTIDNFTVSMHDSWLIFLQLILGLLIIYKNLGIAMFASLAATLIIMLFNSVISKWEEKYQENLMKSKDKRMKMTSEIIRSMKILKLQGWDMSFLSKNFQLREVESHWLRKYMYNSALMNFVTNTATTFVALITFGFCILVGIPLETGTILAALATISVLEGPLNRLPIVISLLIQVKVSLRRIASFMSLEEHQVDAVEDIPLGTSETVIEIMDGNFTWNKSLPTPTLRNISLNVSYGMKVAICGPVGADTLDSKWYSSDNILLGKELDEKRYDKVLEACALKKDLEILPFGDQTIIGERGINLSGGQKQRIQIARAVYHDADIYLLDDPFSALDAHTASHLFKEVVLGLLSGKTVIYVTHQVEFSNGADLILVIKDGSIVESGKYNEILIPGSNFTELVMGAHGALSALGTGHDSDDETQEISSSSDTNIHGAMQDEVRIQLTPISANEKTNTLPPAQLIQEEEKECGSIGFQVYWKYLTTAYAGALALLVLVGQTLCEILRIGSYYWLAWASPISKDSIPFVSGSTLMTVYVSLSIGLSLSSLLVDMLVATVGFTTATILFRKMHDSIFHAPMSFFDATPSGRILNRCSADQSSVETRIPYLVEGVSSSVIQIIGIAALMSTVIWQVLIVIIPVVFACICYQRFYVPTPRDLSRLRGLCQAPVIQIFAETLTGATTIRSFGLESRFQATLMKLLDAYCRPHIHAAAAMKWLMLRIDAFSSITFASLLFLLVFFAGEVDPAIAGVAIIYALRLNNELLGLVWNSSHCETAMISVERILQYITSVPSEAPLIIESNRPDNSWPSFGEICINNLEVRYAPHLPLVLHGLTCTFPGKMKTGIVGRTGSGKSTLIQALFRIVEPTSGLIAIDGFDVSKIGLHDLRSKLGIIPQDPILFQGTMRRNLDPLEIYTDDQIWECLDKCQLGSIVRKLEMKLDAEVTENGENWSVGQRQLVCLGRVLLKKCNVLVLDEATASVDTGTHNLISSTLNHHFSNCTIITIAHRMSSVLDSHMVLLLNNGSIEEFDTPTRLLEDKSSSFSQLVAAYTRPQSKLSDK